MKKITNQLASQCKKAMKSILTLSILLITNLLSGQSEIKTGELHIKTNTLINLNFIEGNVSPHISFNNLIAYYNITKIYQPFLFVDTSIFQYWYRIKFDNHGFEQALIDSLKQFSFIEIVEPIYLHKTFYSPSDSLYSSQYYHSKIKTNKAWDVTKGNSSIAIAVIDDGFRLTHSELKNQIWTNPNEIANNGIDDDNNGFIDDLHGWDVADYDNDANIPKLKNFSSFSHGTLVAGVLIAQQDNHGITGVAPNCKFIPIKTTKDSDSLNGGINDIDGVAYSIVSGAKIINMSFGGLHDNSFTMKALIEYGTQQNLLFIAAAGNHGKDSILTGKIFPAAFENVISVGSTDSNDIKSYFSNYNRIFKVDLFAPGSNIISLDAKSDFGYGTFNGTSLSAPIVSGICALIWANNPSFTNTQVKNCLINSTEKIKQINESQYYNKLGYGRVNTLNAISCIQTKDANFFIQSGRQICCLDSLIIFEAAAYDYVKYIWEIKEINYVLNSELNIFKFQFINTGQYTISLKIVDYNNIILDEKIYKKFISVVECKNHNLKSASTWHFGNKAGLSFKDNSVKQIFTNKHNSPNSYSVLSDYGGKYENKVSFNRNIVSKGYFSYDAEQESMSGLNPFMNCSGDNIYYEFHQKNFLSVPNIINPNESFLFTGSLLTNTLDFSSDLLSKIKINIKTKQISDFNLFPQPSGNIPNSFNGLLTTDGIASIPIDSCKGYWVFAQAFMESNKSQFYKKLYVFKVDTLNNFSIHDSIALDNSTFSSTMKVSLIGDKLAIHNDVYNKLNIYSFNRIGGNLILIDSLEDIFSYFDFSPDGNLIYFINSSGDNLLQHNIMQGNNNRKLIINTRTNQINAISLGPDNIIYINNDQSSWLSAITFPNNIITNENLNQTGFLTKAIDLGFNEYAPIKNPFINSGKGFPNQFYDLNECKVNIIPLHLSCDSVVFTTEACGGYFKWQMGNQIQTSRKVKFLNPNYSNDTVFLTVRGKKIAFKLEIEPPVLNNNISSLKTVPGVNVTLFKTNLKNYVNYEWYRDGVPVSVCPNCSTYQTDKIGMYRLKVNDNCGQAFSNYIEIKYDCDDISLNRNYYNPLGYEFNNGITNIITLGGTNAYFLSGTNIIDNGDTVNILNTNLVMDECSEIIVKNGGFLKIENTIISSCGFWKGIKIEGDSNNPNQRNLGSIIHGSMRLFRSEIRHANVAVLSQKGGFVLVDSNIFRDNAYHIGIQNYAYVNNSFIQKNKFFNTLDYHDNIFPQASGYRRICEQGRDLIPEKNKSMVYIKNAKNIVLFSNYFNGSKQSEFKFYSFNSCGISVDSSSNVTIDKSTFVNRVLNYCLKVEKSQFISVSNNDFRRYMWLEPYAYNYYDINGIYFKENDTSIIQYNKFYDNQIGFELYNKTKKRRNKIIGNDFRNNHNALIMSPSMNPIDAPITANQSTDTMNQWLYCNQFYDNWNAIVGSGGLTYQKGNFKEWACKFDGNQNWDMVWNGYAKVFYYFGRTINQNCSKYTTNLNGREIYSNIGGLSNNGLDAQSKPNNDLCGSSLKRSLPEGFLETEEIETHLLNIYPNPFSNVLIIDGLKESHLNHIELFDMTGKSILGIDIVNQSQLVLNVPEHLTSGLYFVKISNPSETKTFKILKL